MPIAVNVPRGEADIRTLNREVESATTLGDIEMTTEGDQPPSSEVAVADAGLRLGLAPDGCWSSLLLGAEAFMAMRFSASWRRTEVTH